MIKSNEGKLLAEKKDLKISGIFTEIYGIHTVQAALNNSKRKHLKISNFSNLIEA